MRANEEQAIDKFKAEGWSIIKDGWPDYLLVRSVSNGKLEFMGVEVKCGRDQLSDQQRLMHAALLCAGIKVEVVKGVLAQRPQRLPKK
jgi:hypothetical protein